MVGASGATSTGASAAAQTTFTCNTCQFSTNDRPSQHAHYKSDWHIVNLKRQIASLPPIPSSDEDIIKSYVDQSLRSREGNARPKMSATGDGSNRQSVAQDTDDIAITSAADPEQIRNDTDIFDLSACLFCSQHSSCQEENLDHMQVQHGFVIPHQTHLLHLESFLSYLSALVVKFNECLFCGATGASLDGIRQHMIAKGHCRMSSLERGSDYLDFYEFSDTEETMDDDDDSKSAAQIENKKLFEGGKDVVYLSSGRTLGSRSTVQSHRPRRPPHQTEEPLISRQEIRNANLDLNRGQDPSGIGSEGGRQLTIRAGDEKGLIGVSEWQRRALRATEKKLIRDELRARNQFRAGLEKKNNNQKHFEYDVPFPGDHNVRY